MPPGRSRHEIIFRHEFKTAPGRPSAARPCSSACFFLGRQQRPWKPFCEESVCSDWHLYWRTTSTKRSVGNRHFYSYAGMGSKSFREQLTSTAPVIPTQAWVANPSGSNSTSTAPVIPTQAWVANPSGSNSTSTAPVIPTQAWVANPSGSNFTSTAPVIPTQAWVANPSGSNSTSTAPVIPTQEWVANPSGGNSTSTAPVIPTQTWVASTEGPTGGYIPTQTYGATQTYHPSTLYTSVQTYQPVFPSQPTIGSVSQQTRTLYEAEIAREHRKCLRGDCESVSAPQSANIESKSYSCGRRVESTHIDDASDFKCVFASDSLERRFPDNHLLVHSTCWAADPGEHYSGISSHKWLPPDAD